MTTGKIPDPKNKKSVTRAWSDHFNALAELYAAHYAAAMSKDETPQFFADWNQAQALSARSAQARSQRQRQRWGEPPKPKKKRIYKSKAKPKSEWKLAHPPKTAEQVRAQREKRRQRFIEFKKQQARQRQNSKKLKQLRPAI